MTINQIFGTLIVLAIIIFNAPAIPKFYQEIIFYRSQKWDMKSDSGRLVLLQDRMKTRFSKIPIGIIKLGILANQIAFFLMPFIAAINGMIERELR